MNHINEWFKSSTKLIKNIESFSMAVTNGSPKVCNGNITSVSESVADAKYIPDSSSFLAFENHMSVDNLSDLVSLILLPF